MGASVRHPAVAGCFYPADAATLLGDVRSYLSPAGATTPVLGCIAPHAGYVYSGAVAGAVYRTLEIPQRCIVMCPNHTGMGVPLSIMTEAAWETPLGCVPIARSLGEALKKQYPRLTEDSAAHWREHGVEVQLPFLQARRPDVSFVPVALGTGQFEILEELGEAMAEVLRAQAEPVLMIASSDMNHYESDSITRVKDHKAIDQIIALDARGLFDTVMREEISMCGFGPTVVMLTAARRLGATSAELIQYATSGDASGDREMVVGYAGVVVR